MEYFDDFEKPLSQKELKARAKQKLLELGDDYSDLRPVRVSPRGNFAKKFWGKEWARGISHYEDLEHRLPRGRSILRADGVLDLKVSSLKLNGLVLGQMVYETSISFAPLSEEKTEKTKHSLLSSSISLLDLLEGKLPEEIVQTMIEGEAKLFPEPGELESTCNCTDYSDLCEHSAALLYGVTPLFDSDPSLFFVLRGIDPKELLSESLRHKEVELSRGIDSFESDELSEIFGEKIDFS